VYFVSPNLKTWLRTLYHVYVLINDPNRDESVRRLLLRKVTTLINKP